MGKAIGKNAAWIVGVMALILSVAIALSSYYYRTLELNPVAVLHGANMGVRSLFSARSNRSSIDVTALERINERSEKGHLEVSAVDLADLSMITKSDGDVKNQIATNRIKEIQLNQDLSELENIRQQLLNSGSTLDALGKDYADVISLNDIEAARLADIRAALESNLDVPSEASVQALIQKQVGSNSTGRRIPQSVLENVEKTTGISSDEINELMNK